MALDLNDPKAIDYSSEISYYPRNAFGEALLTILSYEESGPAGSEENKSDKEYDVATVRVEDFTPTQLPDSVFRSTPKKGDLFVLWFQTGGDGVTLKNRAYKAAALRNFVSAACGVSDRAFDATKGRKDMLAEDFSDEKTQVRITTKKDSAVVDKDTGAEKPGEFYSKNNFTVAA
jgi:hypothetical protein